MLKIDTWLVAVLNLLDIIVLVYYYNKTDILKPNRWFQFGWNALFWVVFTLERSYVDRQLYNNLILFGFVLGNVFAYERIYIRKLVCGFSYCSCYLIAEAAVAGFLLDGFHMNEGPTPHFTICLNLATKMCMLLYVYCMVIKRKWNLRNMPKQICVTLLLLLQGNVMMGIWFTWYFRSRFPEDIADGIVFTMFGMVLLTVFIYWSFGKLCMYYSETLEKQEIACERMQCEARFREIEKGKEELRKLRHDFKHQLSELNVRLSEENSSIDRQETVALLSEISDRLDKTKNFVYTSYFPVDAILQEKADIAREKQIPMEIEVNICDKLHMKRGDMGIILGNIMDNALEASEKEEHPFIEVRIKQRREQLMIQVRNRCSEKHLKNWKTRKLDKLNHGIGIHSVEETVKEYKGRFEITQNADIVTARVNLVNRTC